MKNRHWLWLLAVLLILVVAFIWGNSLKSIPASSQQSQPVIGMLQPVVDPESEMDQYEVSNYVRKMAHLAEFFVLGLVTGGFCLCLANERKQQLRSLPVLMVLLVAVGDEYIQHFAQRGSLVTDVVLDFAGAMAGLLLFGMVYLLCVKRKKK